MEFARKSVLYWYIAIRGAKPISTPSCRKLMRKMIQAVRDMDKNKIGHRDLKIENIMFSDEYEIKLIDFGHSQPSKDEDGNYLLYSCPKKNPGFGTAEYRTPELVAGEQFTLVEYDLYSLGVILFMMQTKIRPYDEINDKNHKLFVKNNEKYWDNIRKEVKKKGIQIN